MSTTVTATYTLRHRGTDLTVETWVGDGQGEERRPAAGRRRPRSTPAATEEIGSVLLGEDDRAPRPGSRGGGPAGWPAASLVEPGLGEERHRRRRTLPRPAPAPPAVHAWGEAHPTLWAARHVVDSTSPARAARDRRRGRCGCSSRWLPPAARLPRPRRPPGPAGCADWPECPPVRSRLRRGSATPGPAPRLAARLDAGRGARLGQVRGRVRRRGLDRRPGGTPPQARRGGRLAARTTG